MTMKGIPRGLQPLNTLSRSNKPYEDSSKRQRLGTGYERRPSLQMEVSRGSNVRQPSSTFYGDGVYALPSPKRQKVEPQASLQRDGFPSSDGVDPLHYGEDHVINLSRESRRTSQTTSGRSQAIDTQPTDCYVAEYHHVESTMNSNPLKARKKKRRPKMFPTCDSSSSLQDTHPSSPLHPIDLSDDELEHGASMKARERGMERRVDSTPGEISRQPLPQQRIDTGEQSRHFARSASPVRIPRRKLTYMDSTHSNVSTQAKERSLNDQFISTDGNRRNADYNSSPDELADNPNQTFSQTSVFAKKSSGTTASRSASPIESSSSTRKGTPTEGAFGGLAPSSFPISKFDHPASKQAISDCQNPLPRKMEHKWEFVLAAVNMRGTMLRSTDLGLHFNTETASYEVIRGARNLAIDDASLRIQPHKLQKATWSTSGTKIRFLSSRIENSANLLDIELRSEKDCQNLLTRLQAESGNTLDIETKSADYLDRIFNKRLQDQAKVQVSASNPAVDEDEDIYLAMHNKANRKSTPAVSELVDSRATKRRRVDRISDQMKLGKEQPEVSLSQYLGPQDRGRLTDKRKHQDISQVGAHPSRISEIAQNLQPRSQNLHSTRSRIAKPTTSEALLSPTNDTHAEKKPQIYDLGEPWRRPLIYPKIGKKKSTVDWTDLERLNEGEFFNDTLISFYLRYLEHQFEERNPEMAKKVYFFNSFFFESLTKTPRGKKGINYDAVKKWTRDVDIFTRDYVVVPINESFHWYLAVICNLPSLDRDLVDLDEDAVSSPPIDVNHTGVGIQKPQSSGPPSRSSSPLPGGIASQPMRPTHAPKDGTEENTRSSFAELSLGQEDELDDQGMLDAQFKDAQGEVPVQPDEGPQNQVAFCKQVVDHNASSKPDIPIDGPSFRKRKRKLGPPGKRLHPTEPAIVTFDSLAMSHAPTVRILKDYLTAEALTKRNMAFADNQIKGMTAIGIPKQDNFCDCGPYLLGYIDKFFEEPKEFITRTLQKELDIERDWPRLDPSYLRSSIRSLILSLYEEQENERKGSSRKAGKAKPCKPDIASSLDPLQNETKQDKSALEIGTTTASVSAGQQQPSLIGTPETRNEALKQALRVDDKKKVAVADPAIVLPSDTRGGAPATKQHFVVLIESQSAEIQPAVQSTNATSVETLDSEESPPALPSTIQDSQPPETFQSLEEIQYEVPRTPPPVPVHSQARSIAVDNRPPHPPLTSPEQMLHSPRPPRASATSQEYVQID